MKHYTGEILSHRKHGEEYHSLTIVAPDIAEAARPVVERAEPAPWGAAASNALVAICRNLDISRSPWWP